MSIKHKNSPSNTDKFNTVAMQAGLILMTAAATIGMVELPEHPNKVAINMQPVFAVASDNASEPNPLRREREETAPHFISYSVTQRTPGRTGRF